jgi:hypothetical protein
MYRGTLIDIDGTLWLFGNGIYRVKGSRLALMAPKLVQSVVTDKAGRTWFATSQQGVEHLWSIDGKGE